VIQKIIPLASDLNVMEREYGLDRVDRSFRLEEFQAVNIPLDALDA
jgi:hypothetical protein